MVANQALWESWDSKWSDNISNDRQRSETWPWNVWRGNYRVVGHLCGESPDTLRSALDPIYCERVGAYKSAWLVRPNPLANARIGWFSTFKIGIIGLLKSRFSVFGRFRHDGCVWARETVDGGGSSRAMNPKDFLQSSHTLPPMLALRSFILQWDVDAGHAMALSISPPRKQTKTIYRSIRYNTSLKRTGQAHNSPHDWMSQTPKQIKWF